MANISDFASRFRKGLSSPFTPSGLKYCPDCKMEVDSNIQSHHQGTTWAYRERCCRCGHVFQRGVFDNVVLLSGQPLSPAAIEWTLKPGRDRR